MMPGFNVVFGADTSKLEAEITKAQGALSGFGDALKNAFANIETSGLTSAFKNTAASAKQSGSESAGAFDGVKKAVEGVTLGIAAAAIAAATYLEAVGARAVNFGEAIHTAAGAFDQTTASASQIQAVADRSGLSLDDLGKSFAKLSKGAKDGDEAITHALTAIGLKASDVANLSQDALAVKLADAFGKSADSSNKAAAGVALFGEGVAAKLVPQLDQGAAHMRDLEAAANRAGVVIGPDLMAKIDGTQAVFSQIKDRVGELKSAFEGMNLASFQNFKPAIDGLAQAFSDVVRNITDLVEWFGALDGAGQKSAQSTGLMASAATWFSTAVVRATVAVEEFAVTTIQKLNAAGVSFEGLSTVAEAFGHDITSIAQVSANAFYSAYDAAISGVAALFRDLATAGKSALSFDMSGIRSAFDQLGSDAAASGAKIKSALAPDFFSQTKAAYANMAAGAAEESKALDGVIARLEKQKQAQLDLIASGGAKAAPAGTRKVSDPAVPEEKSRDGDAVEAAMKAIQGQIEALRSGLSQKEAIYDEDAKLHIMSEQQKLAATKAAVDQEYEAEKALLQKELQIEGLKATQKQETLNKLTQLDAKYAAEIQKLMAQAAEGIAAPMNKVVDAMSSSIDSSIMGILEGTKNLRQAFVSLAQSVTGVFVKMGVDMVAEFAKAEIGIIAKSIAGQTAQTSAAAAGEAARTSISVAGAAQQAAAGVGAISTALANDAKAVFGGVFAFLAPVLGPAAAAPAAGAAATVMSADIGAWTIPSDRLAMVHQNELIMPAAEAGAFRSMLSAAASGGGGQSGGGSVTHHHHNYNISAMDSKDVSRLFMNNGRALMQGVNNAVSQGHHLGLRNLSRTT